MKLLKDILYKVGIQEVKGATDIAINQITFSSRDVLKYSLFVAVEGTAVDGHKFIDAAIEAGAVAIICQKFPEKIQDEVTYVRVDSSSKALGQIASNYYDNPSEKLKLIGVTGTNGKTTVVSLLFNLFRALGYKTGLLSTVEYRIHNAVIPATHTTPDAIAINKLLAEMVEKGISYCFMEVSSHSVVQDRIVGLSFAGGVFTNITHDHLDYHPTFDDYIKAKKGFFDALPGAAFAVVNKDDKQGLIMLQNTRAKKKTFALKSAADFKVKLMENQFTGMHIILDGNEVWSKLIGGFNAYNLLAVYAVARLLGEEKMEVLTHLSALGSVTGRFQHMKTPGNINAIVDYAHTPDALKNVLETIKEIRTGNEKVITIIGCGGDRDKAKRPLMASIAGSFSEQVILTSDNPRSEDPEVIIKEMISGLDPVLFRKTISITDRREAIKTACSMAVPGDIVLLAGKGHEKYQEVKGEKLPFDDFKILDETLKMLEK